jgi:hypothetical protein
MRVNRCANRIDCEKYLKDEGWPLIEIRRQWKRTFITQELLRSLAAEHFERIDLQTILAYYTLHPQEFIVDDGVIWQDLFLSDSQNPSHHVTWQRANNLISRIRLGESFSTLAECEGDAESALRKNAAGVGYKRGDIRPQELENALFSMNEGEVAIIDVRSGFHIIRLLKRHRNGKLPLTYTIQSEIRNKLFDAIVERVKRRIIASVRIVPVIVPNRFSRYLGRDR